MITKLCFKQIGTDNILMRKLSHDCNKSRWIDERRSSPEKIVDLLSRQIVEEKRRYDRLKNLVRLSLQKSRSDRQNIQQVVRLMREFRDEVALHFTLEVSSDTIKDAIVAAPNLLPKAESLLEDQERLNTEICIFADQLLRQWEEGKSRVPEAILDRWNHFSQRLKEHDAAHRELIVDAYLQDNGSGVYPG